MIGIDEVLRLLEYDQHTGILRWRVSPSRPCKAGAIAGSRTDRGYWRVMIKGRSYLAHRLGWLIVHGNWPHGEIDHINGVKTDNRLCNLREATRSINSQNKRAAQANNKSCGLLGVTWNKQHRKWQSKIMVNKTLHHVGLFDDANVAHSAYLAKKRELHAGCTI